MNRARIRWISALATLTAFGWLGLRELSPPAPLGADAARERFSAGRAMDVVRDVAARPHPIGSAEHARVRDSLVARFSALGLECEARTSTVFGTTRGDFVRAARVSNVVARMRGSATGAARARPVLLAAHYDSVPTGPGAGDDAAGVATLVETARALKAGPPLAADVIFFVTDGEELDLFGARAAILDRALLEEDPIVLNFEARGHRGPSVMFETSDRNAELIAAYAAVAPDPMANSLTFDVYQRLPNDTDFTVFRGAGLEGMNFAFIGGLSHYHTALDAPDALDPGSLQQHGGAALALAQRLGSGAAPSRDAHAGDSIYFAVAREFVVRYPRAWRWPLAIAALLALVIALGVGNARGRTSLVGMSLGILLQALSIGAAAAIAWAISRGVCADPSVRGPEQTALHHDGGRFMLAILLLAAGVHCGLLRLVRETSRVERAWGGGLVIAAVALVGMTVELPGGSYAFTWPVLFGSVGLMLRHLRRDRFEARPLAFVVEALLVLPAPLLFAALPWHLFEAFTLTAAPAVTAEFVVLLGLVAPQLVAATGRSWLLPAALAASGLALIGHTTWNLGVDERRPLQDSLFYACDADLGAAVHASFDDAPDEWTVQRLGPTPERRAVPEFFPTFPDRRLLVSDASWLPMKPAAVDVTSVASGAGARKLRMHVVPGEGVRRVSIELPRARSARLAALDGVEKKGGEFRGVVFEGPPSAGFDAEFDVTGDEPVEVSVVTFRDGLPDATRRPPWIIPAPNLADTTLVRVTARG